MLRDLKEIFGIPVDKLVEYEKTYKFFSLSIYIGDFLLILISTAILYEIGASFEAYGFVIVSVALIFYWLTTHLLKPELHNIFKLYKKYGDSILITEKYDVNENELRNIIYSAGYHFVKRNGSIAYYKELMLSLCKDNIKYSSKLIQYLRKYKSDKGIECISINCGDTSYFINFKEENITDGSSEHSESGNVEAVVDNGGKAD